MRSFIAHSSLLLYLVIAFVSAAVLLTNPKVFAQSDGSTPTESFIDSISRAIQQIPNNAQTNPRVKSSQSALIRVIDRLNRHTSDVALSVDVPALIGNLHIELIECRYFSDKPLLFSQSYLQIYDFNQPAFDLINLNQAPADSNDFAQSVDPPPLFSGWMLAESPSINALEHPRYDVWLLGCII